MLHVKFIRIYDAYFDDIYRYVYVKTGNKWDAEDLVGEVFRKAFEKCSSLAEHPNEKAWLFTIARNTIIDFYRKKKSVLIGDQLEYFVSPVDFEDPFEGANEKECLQKSLPHLSKEDLEITQLRYFANLKFKEMAMILNKEEGSLRVKSSRITKKLGILVRKCLGES
ncbi:sigma-70 family RNA polymerase sigma factor [Sporosarcina sp. 179-K 3D1 HS]|uniref:RNA polymerase sigma factor n=1 Tax=Sporosarcina sp. 179-K 3D1 HS TaxID=3232169 RepID=UPI00399EED4A